MSQATVRVGVVGCGRIAMQRHIPALAAMRGVEVAALADCDAEALRSAGDRFGIADRHPDAASLLGTERLDAVLVSTPPGTHYEPARAVLEAEKHLFVESPMALSIAHCDELIGLASRAGVVATVGLNLRHHPMNRRAKRCIQEGRIGPLQAIASTFTTPSRGQRGDRFPEWRRPDILDGSVFAECAVQFFDVWSDLANGRLDQISVQCAATGGPVSVSATVGDSVVAAAVFSEYSGDNSETRLMGRDGTLSLSYYRYNGFEYCTPMVGQGSPRQYLRRALGGLRALPRGVRLAPGGGEYAQTFKRQLEVFVEAIRDGTAPLVSLEDGRASAAAVLAGFESMKVRRPVALSEILSGDSGALASP